MKKVLFQAALLGLFVCSSPAVAQYNYNQPVQRYPLNQTGSAVSRSNPYPGYNAPQDRNAIQQPQLYSGQANQNYSTQRIFTPGQTTPLIANNYPFGFQDANKQGQGQTVSPSELPIPKTNGSQEQIAPRVNSPMGQSQQNIQSHQQFHNGQIHGGQAPTYQPHPQQYHPQTQQYHPQTQHGHQQVYPHPNQNQIHGHQGQVHPVPDQGQFINQNCQPGTGAVGYGGNNYYQSGNVSGAVMGQPNYTFGQGFLGANSLAAPGCGPVVRRQGYWFGGLGGLIFNRDYEDDKFFAYPLGMPLTKSLSSTDADVGSMGGIEATFGKRFCNGTGFQVTYWGIFSETGTGTASGGDPQTTWPSASYMNYNVGSMDGYLNPAVAFRVRRTNEFHNVELNFLRYTLASNTVTCATGCGGVGRGFGAPVYGGGQYGGIGFRGAGAYNANYGAGCNGNGGYSFGSGAGCNGAAYGNAGCGQGACGVGGQCGPACGTGPVACGRPGLGLGRLAAARTRPFQFDLLAGIRFFKFDENFLFRSSTPGDYSNHINDIYYDIDVDNRLIGVQVGGLVEYCLFPSWTLTGGTKLGIYGNSISHRQQLYGLAGYAQANTGGYVGQDYNIMSTKTDVAFLGQFDLGMRYNINCHWSAGFGYRVVAVTGVALAPEQIPSDFSDYADATYINSNGGLILHGTYFRLQRCF